MPFHATDKSKHLWHHWHNDFQDCPAVVGFLIILVVKLLLIAIHICWHYFLQEVHNIETVVVDCYCDDRPQIFPLAIMALSRITTVHWELYASSWTSCIACSNNKWYMYQGIHMLWYINSGFRNLDFPMLTRPIFSLFDSGFIIADEMCNGIQYFLVCFARFPLSSSRKPFAGLQGIIWKSVILSWCHIPCSSPRGPVRVLSNSVYDRALLLVCWWQGLWRTCTKLYWCTATSVILWSTVSN